MKKILIVTAGLGNGHNAAAQGIYRQKQEESRKNNFPVSLEIIDMTKITLMGKIMQWFFFHLSESALEKLFDDTDRNTPNMIDRFFYTTFFSSLTKKIKRNEYDEIIFTFPCFPLCVPSSFSGKIIIQITDYISPHRSWLWGKFDEIHVLDSESKKYLSEYVSEQKIKIGLFPLADISPKTKNKRENKIGNTQEKKIKNIVLFFHNVLLGNEEEVIQKITKKYPEYSLTLLAGRNYKYFKNKNLDENSITILPWEKNIENVYENADIVGGKCGGAFISEVMQRNLPLIITGVFSGQERGNVLYLHKYYAHNLVEI